MCDICFLLVSRYKNIVSIALSGDEQKKKLVIPFDSLMVMWSMLVYESTKCSTNLYP